MAYSIPHTNLFEIVEIGIRTDYSDCGDVALIVEVICETKVSAITIEIVKLVYVNVISRIRDYLYTLSKN